MSAIVPILVSIFVFFFIIGLVIFLLITNKKHSVEEIEPNAVIIKNITHKKWSDGSSDMLLIKSRENKNGTTWIKAIPRDYRQGEDIKPKSEQIFVCLSENIVKFARGEMSNEREEWWIISKEKADYPERIRNSLMTDFTTAEGIKGFIIETFKTTTKEMDLGIAEGMKGIAGGQVSAMALAKMKEEIEQKAKLLNDNTKKKDEE